MRAIDIQRAYLESAREFVAQAPATSIGPRLSWGCGAARSMRSNISPPTAK
jgi:hypothetical protein